MKERRLMFLPLLLFSISLLAVAAWGAEAPKIDDPKDQRIVDAFLAETLKVPERITPERCREFADQEAEEGEAFTWRVMPYLRMPVTAFELTRDPKYLDIFVETFDNMRSAMTPGPDGYLGWYGFVGAEYRDPDDPKRRIDALISAFSTAKTVCDFVALVDSDPALRERYAKQRAEYLDLVENQLVKKHDVRGDYVDMGELGAVYRMPKAGLRPDAGRLTMPHNKHAIIMHGLLALYRVTGKDEYIRKAIKLGVRYKRSLTLKDGHYEWDYWDPAGAWDISPLTPNKWKHWIGREHRGGYYDSSMSQAIELYQFGLVFDRTDVDRFLRTQLDMCWNGDFDHPQWSRVDGTRPPEYTQGAYMASALAPFNDRVAQFLFTGSRQESRLQRAGDDWEGGPVANGYIRSKLLEYPAMKGGKQIYLEYGKKLLTKKENQDFVNSLAFEVTGSGYQQPLTPPEMKPLPHAPKP
jgi:hypothetical protein